MQPILLADGDRKVRDALCRGLRGFQLLYAPTAARALSIAEQHKPRFAIIECLLRDLPGLELLRRLKTMVPRLPAVMISPYDFDWIRLTALQAGAQGYFAKPVDTMALRALIERSLLKSSGIVENSNGRRADHLLVRQAVSFVDQHFAECISLVTVASHLGVSKFTLCRKFKNERGVSFRTYLMHRRLQHARTLLADENRSITEIAHLVGFGDLPRFDKVFKRATGITPSAHRHMLAFACPELPSFTISGYLHSAQ